ncbi:sensor histidine kinase [Desulfobacter vibrioformis]|uniref:sensor histidine kinase n=1 Tax=Desulfobacter vibrioformis TaxID=34031 RepID=UPI000553A926|nr:PAS domain-containing sensor histidine kinase [Desulfobacter vibrioformis]
MSRLKQNRQQLKRVIFLNMTFFPMIPFIIVLGISFYFFSSTLDKSTQASLERILTDHRKMIESFLLERKSDLELITRAYTFQDIMAEGAIGTICHSLQERSAAFVDLGLFDETGNHLKYSGSFALAGKRYTQEPWFQKTMLRGFYISDIFLGYRNIPHFVVAVRRTENNKTWVLRATIDTVFFDSMVSGVRMGKTGEAYILNHEGVAQTARRSGDIALLDKDPAFGWMQNQFSANQQTFQLSPKGQPFLYAVSKLANKSWYLVVRQEKHDVYRALYSAVLICVGIAISGLAALVVLAYFTSETICRRMERLDEEKEQLGSQLIRAVQLAEIGEMAAGFAHEINNPLQIIKSEYALIKILMEELYPGKDTVPDPQTFNDIRESVDQIHKQVERCHEITSAILKFGRKKEVKHTTLDPGTVIPEILKLVENSARTSGVEILTRIEENVPSFMGDPGRFQQVMLNLVNNAMHAVTNQHGAQGGRIEISAAQTRDNEGQTMVNIQVKDNGCGIAPEHMDKIFSPFFTTKAVGKGTGLGLSVCFGIIESFGGTMSVDSRPGEGTVFSIQLAAHENQSS